MTAIPIQTLISCNTSFKQQKPSALMVIQTGLYSPDLYMIWARCFACLANHSGQWWEILFLLAVNSLIRLCIPNFLKPILITGMKDTILNMGFMNPIAACAMCTCPGG